jgi:hypothetical protein
VGPNSLGICRARQLLNGMEFCLVRGGMGCVVDIVGKAFVECGMLESVLCCVRFEESS